MRRAVAAVVVLGLAGCDRCNGNGGGGGADAAPPVTPVDGTITEAMAIKVAGPVSTGKISAMTPMTVTCSSQGQPVSPRVFGIAFADADKDLGATTHRWGGNTTSRYNWKLGNAWNTAHDWFYENVAIDSYEVFLGKAASLGGSAAITIPMIGWVAKDTKSASFPVSQFGPQAKLDPDHPDFGNGIKPDGKTPIKPGPQSLTSVPFTPEDAAAWVAKIKANEKATGKKLVYEYILDNEPGLWSTTHNDVHPDPMTYDELLEKTIAFGTAIRKADPDAKIAGPASYGWWEYFWSTKDHDEGIRKAPDRKAHGDQPLLEWYLSKLAEHEKKTGVRVLDTLDVHIYPQADDVQGPDGHGGDGGGKTDRATNDLRYRTTRSLWDRGYKDESWIADSVYLIPRMKEIIAKNYPGRGLEIGEYNFGAEVDPAGGVALAEVLGRFALFGVESAYYWTWPKRPSAAYWAFRAFRNYDDKGGHFLERIVPTSSPSGTSLYASRDEAGKKWVLIALNFSADRPDDASVALDGCAAPSSVRSFVYIGGDGMTPGNAKVEAGKLTVKLPPTSITVVELAMP